MNPQEFILLFLVALTANTLSAMAGGGAGLLQLPILIFLSQPYGTALATHRIATVALGIGSMARYWKENILTLRFSAYILCLGLPSVMIGSLLILQINETLAIFSLGLLTIGLGIYSFFKKNLGQLYAPRNRHTLGLIFGGIGIFLIGLINGTLTSGTGLFLTLWLIYWFGFDYRRAVAYTLILVGFFWNATGALTLSILGSVKWEWLIPLVPGSLIGGYLGANIAIKKGNHFIKRLFEIMTVVVGLSLIIKALSA